MLLCLAGDRPDMPVVASGSFNIYCYNYLDIKQELEMLNSLLETVVRIFIIFCKPSVKGSPSQHFR